MYQGGNQRFASPEAALWHISEQAWSTWTKADYTLEQWHSACLVHIHDGSPTAKSQCKLPVKTPDGTLNRNGVHAAAAALAGARGGLKGVSADQKAKAAAALRRYYAQLEEEPPNSLAQMVDLGAEFVLAHFGVKGMKWGVRKEREGTRQDAKGLTGNPAAILGAVYVAVILGSLISVTMKSHKEAKIAKDDSGEAVQKQNKDVPWKKKPELAKKMSADELYDKVVVQVNPKFGAPGTKMNCRRCTFSYEMRRRGNDVRATSSVYATGQDIHGLRTATMQFGGTTRKDQVAQSVWGHKQVASPAAIRQMSAKERSDSIFSHLSQQPDGARGEVAVSWSFGGGHSMAYEVVNHKPIVIDTQNSKMYRTPRDFDHFARTVNDAAYTRTDNIPLDEKYLRRWMTNV